MLWNLSIDVWARWADILRVQALSGSCRALQYSEPNNVPVSLWHERSWAQFIVAEHCLATSYLSLVRTCFRRCLTYSFCSHSFDAQRLLTNFSTVQSNPMTYIHPNAFVSNPHMQSLFVNLFRQAKADDVPEISVIV